MKLLNNVETINTFDWADCYLENVALQFDAVTLTILDDKNSTYNLECLNHIGMNFTGLWDDLIIRSIRVEKGGSFLEKCIESIKGNYGDRPIKGGGVKSLDDDWFQLNVVFIDGVVLSVACNSFIFTRL